MTTRPCRVTSNESLRELAVKNHTSESCRHIALLSELMFRGYAGDSSALLPDRNILRTESPANEQEFNEFLRLADAHHVTVRALGALKKIPRDGNHAQLEERGAASLEA